MFFKTEPDIITTTQWQRWYTVYDVRDNDSCLKLQQMFISIQKSVTPFFKASTNVFLFLLSLSLRYIAQCMFLPRCIYHHVN